MKMIKHKVGFTLLEILFTLAIISILAVIAIALFLPQLREGRRSDAINTIMAISLAEERYRSSNTTYGTLAQVWSGVTASPQGYYTMSLSNVTATSYTVTATAQGGQASDVSGSTACTPLVFAMSNGTITKTPAACWP